MSDTTTFRVLWAASSRYQCPNFIAAFSGGLVEAMPEEYDERVEEAKAWFLGFGDPSDGESTPDSRRYAACGDGVVSNVSEWLARGILREESSVRRAA